MKELVKSMPNLTLNKNMRDTNEIYYCLTEKNQKIKKINKKTSYPDTQTKNNVKITFDLS